MSKIKCFNCGEYGHYAQDCLKACNNANIALESEQNKKVKNMLDLDNSSVSEECTMMCMEVQHEYREEDLVVYGDQGISTEEFEKATYGKLTKTQSEEEEEVKCNMALCAKDSMSLEKKRRQLNKTMPDKNIHDVSWHPHMWLLSHVSPLALGYHVEFLPVSQSDVSLNENPTRNTFNNEATVVQGPTGDNDEIKSQKAWTMEMPMNDGNISTTMTNGLGQVSRDYKKFLYARVTHSNHAIQYHMQQILERQKVVNEYRSMKVEGMDLIPLESKSYKSDLVVISHHSNDRSG